jgi:pSer/pThr/pTyr-binding forkhead associated (FHA) protein
MSENIDITVNLNGENQPTAKPRLKGIAILSPVSGAASEMIQLHEHETIIGRDDSVTATIPAPDVSRRHARIYRNGSDFIIEDLGSSNGTFIDDVEIVACVLRNGDTVRIGQHVFYFDRLLVHAENGGVFS